MNLGQLLKKEVAANILTQKVESKDTLIRGGG